MVFLELEKNDTKISVEVNWEHNYSIPHLHYYFLSHQSEMDANDLKTIFTIAEANINGILAFDEKYQYDCQADISDGVTIAKCCCDDETDNPYFVDFPKQNECRHFGNCNICYQKCPYEIE